MSKQNINAVMLTGNLTQDPELNHTGSGTVVANLRVAVNGSRKDAQSGEWVDKANFFNVTVWGALAEACNKYRRKGDPVAIAGRLDWREWEAKDGSGTRQAVAIIANTVEFLNRREASSSPAASDEQEGRGSFEPEQALAGVAGGGEDDIPF
jgi:single-strand DNA-binding protein